MPMVGPSLVTISRCSCKWPGKPRSAKTTSVKKANPGMISKRGSKSTMVDASCFKMRRPPLSQSRSHLRFKSFRSRHRLRQIGAIDGERQIRLVGKETLDVGQRRILKLNQEFFAV